MVRRGRSARRFVERQACDSAAGRRLAGYQLGAEPSGRAGRQTRCGRTRGQVLAAYGQRARPRSEADDDGHLHSASRRTRRDDPLNPGPVVRGQQRYELTDVRPHAIGGAGNDLPRRARPSQDLDDHLSELQRPGGALAVRTEPGRG